MAIGLMVQFLNQLRAGACLVKIDPVWIVSTCVYAYVCVCVCVYVCVPIPKAINN